MPLDARVRSDGCRREPAWTTRWAAVPGRRGAAAALLATIISAGLDPAAAQSTAPQPAQSGEFSLDDPAGDIGTAASLGPKDEVAGSITVDDRDCYRIFPLDRALVATLRPEPFGPLNAALIDRELRLLDETGAVLAEKVDWTGDDDVFTVDQSLAARAAFLCVSGRFNGWIGDYRLSFDRFAP